MFLRIDYDDPGTSRTLEGCARAVSELASSRNQIRVLARDN